MSVTFDGINKLIIVSQDITDLSVAEDIYSPWKQWVIQGDNAKYLPAFRVVGGDPTVGNNKISAYFFLLNGWKLRPFEGDHTLTISGILLVEGGGDPFVSTLGNYNVRINTVTPLQAESVVLETGTSGLTPEESTKLEMLQLLNTELLPKMLEVWRLHGLDPDHPLVVNRTSRYSGDIVQNINAQGSGNNQETTVTRG
jgi:hypothetical protein